MQLASKVLTFRFIGNGTMQPVGLVKGDLGKVQKMESSRLSRAESQQLLAPIPSFPGQRVNFGMLLVPQFR